MIRVATTSELSWQPNDLLTILLAAVYSGTGNCFSKIVNRSFILQQRPRCSLRLSEICKSVIEKFWDEVYIWLEVR